MKKNYILFLVLFFLSSLFVKAQTTLAAGDLAFTGYNSNPLTGAGDYFSFVLLKDISSGTSISFTDRGYLGGASWQTAGSSESTITWTSDTELTSGTEIYIVGLVANVYDPSDATSTANGTVARTEGTSTNGLSLSNVGDQIIAFQSSNGTITGSGLTMIAGINYFYNPGGSIANWNSGASPGPNYSLMPPGLTGGTNAFYTGTTNGSSTPSSGKFNNCVTINTESTPAAIRTALMNQANWQLDYSSPGLSIPSACSAFSLPVIFGSVTASLKNNELLINWQTLAETNNDHFIVEASTDGILFKEIGTLKSIAHQGNSDVPLNYILRLNTNNLKLFNVGGLALLLLLFLLFKRYRKWWGVAALICMPGFIACNKTDANKIDVDDKLYIRIAQVDKDGTKQYSNVIKVTVK